MESRCQRCPLPACCHVGEAHLRHDRNIGEARQQGTIANLHGNSGTRIMVNGLAVKTDNLNHVSGHARPVEDGLNCLCVIFGQR